MEAFYAYVKATIYKLVGFTCIVTAVLFLGGWWQYISGWCIGSGLNIVYFFMLSSRSVRALKLPPGQAVPVHFPGGCRGRYLFVPRPRLRRCTDCASQTVKERRYCVWNYMQGIIWSSSSWV